MAIQLKPKWHLDLEALEEGERLRLIYEHRHGHLVVEVVVAQVEEGSAQLLVIGDPAMREYIRRAQEDCESSESNKGHAILQGDDCGDMALGSQLRVTWSHGMGGYTSWEAYLVAVERMTVSAMSVELPTVMAPEVKTV